MLTEKMCARMKRGTHVINCARGRLVEHDVVVEALISGQVAGHAGDVWFPEPARLEHPGALCPLTA